MIPTAKRFLKEKYRSFLTIVSFLVFGAGSVFYNFFLFPVIKKILSENKFIFFSSFIIHKSWKFFVSFLQFIGLIKLEIENGEKLSRIKNKIIVATHPSYADILVLISLIPETTCFVKKSLTENPVMNNLVNSIFIPNDIPLNDLNKSCEKYFSLGFNLTVFPAGTRHKNNEKPKIKKGASFIALGTKKDIVPVKISTEGEFLPAGKPFYHADIKTVKFKISVRDTIKIDDFSHESEIAMKRNITNEISKALYE